MIWVQFVNIQITQVLRVLWGIVSSDTPATPVLAYMQVRDGLPIWIARLEAGFTFRDHFLDFFFDQLRSDQQSPETDNQAVRT